MQGDCGEMSRLLSFPLFVSSSRLPPVLSCMFTPSTFVGSKNPGHLLSTCRGHNVVHSTFGPLGFSPFLFLLDLHSFCNLCHRSSTPFSIMPRLEPFRSATICLLALRRIGLLLDTAFLLFRISLCTRSIRTHPINTVSKRS